MSKRIRLELARDAAFPQGSARHGFEFVAPLDDAGLLDSQGFAQMRERCHVVRFWGDDEHETGYLQHQGHGAWGFHYQNAGDVAVGDEAGFKFQSHPFQPGNYVAIREPDGELRTFRVMRVSDA